MFRRRPRYLVDEHGNVRPIYHREGSFFPYLGRFLRRDEANMQAVQINGKWVLVEVDGNEQLKTVELAHTINRRRHLVKSFFLAVLFGCLGLAIFRFKWDFLAAAHVGRTAYADTNDRDTAYDVIIVILWAVRLIAAGLLFFCYIYTLAVVVALIKEILYQLRFPFMRGAKTTEMPRIAPPPAVTARETWDAESRTPARLRSA